jgi:hypothetical protein
MKLFSLLLLSGAVAAGSHMWHTHQSARWLNDPDSYGAGAFVPAMMPREAQRDTVLIVAPIDCPRNAARTRRSQALAQALTRMRVPNEVKTNISFQWDVRDADAQANYKRTTAVLNDGPPIVFINGMAKAAPSPEEVADIVQHRQRGS